MNNHLVDSTGMNNHLVDSGMLQEVVLSAVAIAKEKVAQDSIVMLHQEAVVENTDRHQQESPNLVDRGVADRHLHRDAKHPVAASDAHPLHHQADVRPHPAEVIHHKVLDVHHRPEDDHLLPAVAMLRKTAATAVLAPGSLEAACSKMVEITNIAQ